MNLGLAVNEQQFKAGMRSGANCHSVVQLLLIQGLDFEYCRSRPEGAKRDYLRGFSNLIAIKIHLARLPSPELSNRDIPVAARACIISGAKKT
jgi:hypothetical protein